MEERMNLITLIGILSSPDEKDFFNLTAALVISISVANCKKTDSTQAGQK